MIDLDAIRVRDAHYNVAENTIAIDDDAETCAADRHALLAYVDELRGLLRNVLDAGEVEAKAEAEMRNAKRNYTNPRPYVDAWERAMVAASNAEKEARAALAGAADEVQK